MNLKEFISHSRHRNYMSGVERDHQRIKSTGEVFTPTELVQEILDRYPISFFVDPNKTFLDPTCGDGQFLSEIIILKMENGSSYNQALKTIYGADLMEDNCRECIRRLYGEGNVTMIKINASKWPKDYHIEDGLMAIFYWNNQLVNIVQADGQIYNYNFGEKPVLEALNGEC